ncbi:MAG: AI-2E family transporter, partial [Syntrophomonadaceae bacterium]|nr:AI-2E family transporter [Syntrophomonadaceae bacterium]
MQVNSRKLSHYLIFFLVLIISIYFLYLVREVLLTFFLGALLAYLLFRPVSYIEKKGLKRIWAIVLLYLGVAAILALILALAIPGLVKELNGLAKLYPHYAQQAQEMAGKIDQINAPEQLNQVINKNLGKLESYIYQVLNGFL